MAGRSDAKTANSNAMRIALLFDDSLDRNDGVQQYIKALGAYYTNKGHEVSYLCGQTALDSWHGAPVYSLAKNYRVTYNHNRLTIPLWATRRRIAHALQSAKPDVLHVMVPYSPVLARRVITQFKGPVVGTFHIMPAGGWAAFGNKLLGWLLQRQLRSFAWVVAVSRPAAQFAQHYYGVTADVVPNVVNIASFNTTPQRPLLADGKAHVVFLGRLVRRKGCFELLQALDLIRAQGQLQGIHVTILGDGPERAALEAYASRQRLLSHVTFYGFVEEADKAALLASADVAIFPSLGGESFGIVLLEAMAAGAGVVLGGNNPGYASVLDLCNTPEAIINPQPTQLAHAILEYSQNSAARTSLHTKQQLAVHQFDVPVVGNRLLLRYRDAIANYVSSADNTMV